MGINNIKDYYYILGLDGNASKDEIKKAYRKLSLKFHPDHNIGDKFFEERFRDVNEAYETLIDDIKRKLYDEKLNRINNTGTGEKNYSNTPGSQSQQPKKQQAQKPAGQPPPEPSLSSGPQKKRSAKAIWTIIAIILFVTPVILKTVISNLSKGDNPGNYNDSSRSKTTQNSSYDTVTPSTKTNTDTASSNTPVPGYSGSSRGSPDTTASTTISQNDNSPSVSFKDDDSLTAADVLKYFLQDLNNNDCNGAWNMTYNTTWINNGKDWFCSSAAFGGVRKVLIRNIYPVTQSTEAEIYVDYYAEDSYNGNKCFKQNITVQKIAFTDNKTRWRITKMKNVEEPVVCDGN